VISKEGKIQSSGYFFCDIMCLQNITSLGSPRNNLELQDRKLRTVFCRDNENEDLCMVWRISFEICLSKYLMKQERMAWR